MGKEKSTDSNNSPPTIVYVALVASAIAIALSTVLFFIVFTEDEEETSKTSSEDTSESRENSLAYLTVGSDSSILSRTAEEGSLYVSKDIVSTSGRLSLDNGMNYLGSDQIKTLMGVEPGKVQPLKYLVADGAGSIEMTGLSANELKCTNASAKKLNVDHIKVRHVEANSLRVQTPLTLRSLVCSESIRVEGTIASSKIMSNVSNVGALNTNTLKSTTVTVEGNLKGVTANFDDLKTGNLAVSGNFTANKCNIVQFKCTSLESTKMSSRYFSCTGSISTKDIQAEKLSIERGKVSELEVGYVHYSNDSIQEYKGGEDLNKECMFALVHGQNKPISLPEDPDHSFQITVKNMSHKDDVDISNVTYDSEGIETGRTSIDGKTEPIHLEPLEAVTLIFKVGLGWWCVGRYS